MDLGGRCAPEGCTAGTVLPSFSAMICLPPGRWVVVRARSVLVTPGAARRLSFGLSGAFAFFLMPGLSAVGDLRQELANVFYFFLSPEMYSDASARGCFGLGDLPCFDIAAQSHGSNPELLSCLACRESLH